MTVTGATFSAERSGQTATAPRRDLQPLVQDAILCVAAPTMAISDADGQIRSGAHGLYESDRRILSRLVLTVGGEEPEPLRGQLVGTSDARFASIVRTVGEDRADPPLVIDRRRTIQPPPPPPSVAARPLERVHLHNAGRVPLVLEVALEAACDLIDIADVKGGRGAAPLTPAATGDGLAWKLGECEAMLRTSPAPDRIDPGAGEICWTVALEPGQTWEVQLSTEASIGGSGPAAFPVRATATPGPIWHHPVVECDDLRVVELVERSLADLAGLRLADPEQPDDQFLAAGAPWFLTLFGRDAIWSARMLLPLGTALAAGTLRALARRQGTTSDPITTERPGKILHELRAEGGGGLELRLPARYYGTVDATPLFVTLLAEAWRWGLAEDQVAALLPNAERALAWLRDSGDPDGDGFVEYVPDGTGLANQGWKDSWDGVQSAAGVLAESPIALCEVQGYAYQAARDGADLLDAFGRPGGAAWRDWAGHLRDRFAQRFWVSDAEGPYLAIALDAAKRPVDGVASNMGHVLGTGILDADGAAAVARRLGSRDLDSGYGLRTFSARSARYNPLGYHVGSIWPHDTAIAIDGLVRTGHGGVAARLARGLVDAAHWFDDRLPELFSGEQREPGVGPLPHPTACRPQAWSAAAAILILTALFGLHADVPGGRLTVSAARPMPYRRLSALGLDIGGGRLDLRLLDGEVEVDAPPGLRVEIR